MTSKTITGNRVDDSLAHGMARTMIRTFFPSTGVAAPDYRIEPVSAAERLRILRRIAAEEGMRHVGMVTRKNHLEAIQARLYGLERVSDPGSAGKMVLSQRRINLSFNKATSNNPYTASQDVAIIHAHVIARMIQRGGMREPRDIVRMFRTCGGWTTAATNSRDPAPFFVPIEQGLVCVKMFLINASTDEERYPDAVMRKVSFHLPSLATFIDRSSLSGRALRAWTELVDLGGLKDPFPFPSFDKPTASALALLHRSQELGRGWLEARGADDDAPLYWKTSGEDNLALDLPR
ncbi:hypothetical protein LAZ40_05540 [Cereibacter sphaeroides]|uniref:hypothetical protein n=1 Tax=Cereibacter sphaeroides TaxID=1063 RepID=UPI001F3E4790|nr:hypothetical protein [Cereibacter sphaeroides]MCE6958512.1 hypothetical protein [Cereibacter sphaeroides]MCE6972826.1 hypothetical protein [Cereibacter sphaeroides]